MFEIGFSELCVIAGVALVVLGPERLPELTRKAGIWLGQLQRYLQRIKADLQQEIALEELQRLQTQMHSFQQEIRSAVHHTEQEIHTNFTTLATSLENATHDDARQSPSEDKILATYPHSTNYDSSPQNASEAFKLRRPYPQPYRPLRPPTLSAKRAVLLQLHAFSRFSSRHLCKRTPKRLFSGITATSRTIKKEQGLANRQHSD